MAKLKTQEVTQLIQHRTKLKLRAERDALASFVLNADTRREAIETLQDSPQGKELVDLSEEQVIEKALAEPGKWVRLLAKAMLVVQGKEKSIKPDDEKQGDK